MLNKRIELVKPADEARQALEAADLNVMTLRSGLTSLDNENCSSFITPAAPAENAVQTMKRAVKEFWANGGLVKYAICAMAIGAMFVVVCVSCQQVYNIYAVGYNLLGSVRA